MGNGALGTVVAPPGGAFAIGPGSTLCKAYLLGLAEWCAAANSKPRGDFNNFVFNKLKDVEPDGASVFNTLSPQRELPIGAIFGDGSVQGFANIANGGGPLAAQGAEALSAVAEAIKAGGFAGGSSFLFRIAGASAMRSAFGGTTLKRVLCPDALQPNGRPLEIKRPNEPPSHNNQIENYKKASPDGQCDELNCQSCAAPGSCPKSGDCPAPSV